MAVVFSDRDYFWLVVFEWNHKNDAPFSLHVINPTFVNIVPQDWIRGKLQDEHRVIKMKIKTLSHEFRYSVFAKVEKGKVQIKHHITFNIQMKHNNRRDINNKALFYRHKQRRTR